MGIYIYIYIYIRVEVKIVNEKSKSFLCVRERKSLEILNQMKKNSSLKTLNIKCNKKLS